jgi:ABC-type glycerol-3-phosphate transport system substrate-binding protein
MKLFKSIALIVLFVFVAVATSGCSLFGGNKQVAPKVIIIWGFDDEDVWKPYIKDLSGTVKGYEIKYVKKTLDSNYENDALNSMLSGQGPDVWTIPNDWVYRHKDKLAVMPEALSKEMNIDEQFVPMIKESGVIDGKIYSLSPTVDTLMIYYNPSIVETVLNELSAQGDDSEFDVAQEIFSQPSATWTQLIDKIKILTKKEGNEIIRAGAAIGTSNNVTESEKILYALLLQNEVTTTSEKIDLATFNLPSSTAAGTSETPGKKALDFYKSFSDPGSVNYTWNKSMPNDIDAFLSGKAAMIFGRESLSRHIAQIKPDFEFQKSPFPQIGTNYSTVIDYGYSNFFVVPLISKYPEQAWQIISFLSSDMSSSYSTTTGVASSEKMGDFVPSVIREGGESLTTTQAQTAHTWIKGRYPNTVDLIFREVINNVSTQGQDTQTALDLAAAKVTDLLRKDSW